MRPSARRADDADVIRARLRALLDDRQQRGWVPDDSTGWPEETHGAIGSGASAYEDEDDPEDDEGADDPIRAAERSEAGGRSAGSTTGQDMLPGGVGRHRLPGPTARLDPGRPAARALWIAGLVAALVLVGWTWLDRPRVEPASPAASGVAAQEEEPGPETPSVGEVAETSAAPLVVAVVGLVARPGLVTLPAGARVADAVAAAGGLLPDADPASVNLAAPVADGQQIAVGVPGAGPVGGLTAPGGGAGAAGVPAGTLDLNTATAAELDALPGLGPVLAQRIVDHRTQHGPFRSVGQLEDVPGIGPAVAGGLAERVRV